MPLRFLLILAAIALLAGCAAQQQAAQQAFQGQGAPALAAGIKQFEEGLYPEASKSLNSALEQGLASTADFAKAHKYLAFIHCASKRQAQCRDEFGKALDANPKMELEPNEVGHPLWGPVFRAIKAKRPS